MGQQGSCARLGTKKQKVVIGCLGCRKKKRKRQLEQHRTTGFLRKARNKRLS